MEQLTQKVEEQLAQVEQLSEQFEWLQAEHLRVSGSNQDLEQQNRTLQEDCFQLQVSQSTAPASAPALASTPVSSTWR